MQRKIVLTFTLSVFALILCALPMLMQPAGAQRPPTGHLSPPSTPFILPTTVPGSCCGKKPQFADVDYSRFKGQVAVFTKQAKNGGDPVLGVVDLEAQAQPPLNTNLRTQWNVYQHADWTLKNLGDVFGLTLDSDGNIYLAATSIYKTPGTLGQFGVLGAGGGSGDVYRIDSISGLPTRFIETHDSSNWNSAPANMNKIPNAGLSTGGGYGPNNNGSGVGLGNIHYSCAYKQWYISNFEDGMIYRFTENLSTHKGVYLSRWDHGLNGPPTIGAETIRNSATKGMTGLGRRVWGLQTHNGRLYYAVWSDDQTAGANSEPNAIWSVALTVNGDFDTAANSVRKEFDVPDLPIGPLTPAGTQPHHSNPVSDISFGPTGNMLLAERSMASLGATAAHRSRVLEYKYDPQTETWSESGNSFNVGNSHYSGFNMDNSAGGCDYDYRPNERVWYTGDALHYQFNPTVNQSSGSYVYGLQGAPSTGTGPTAGTSNSLLFDIFGTNATEAHKWFVGDVEIPCPKQCEPPPTPVISVAVASCGEGEYCVQGAQASSIYSWSVTGGVVQASTTGQNSTCIKVRWNSTTGRSITLTATNRAGCSSTSTLNLENCATPPTATDPCCPPWNKAQMLSMMHVDQPVGLNVPYTMNFNPSSLFNSQMQAYINYLYSVDPGMTQIVIAWSLHDQGPATATQNNGITPPNPTLGPTIPLVSGTVTTTWTQGGNGTPVFSRANFFDLPTAHPMQVGRWYRVHTKVYLAKEKTFFSDKCSVADMEYEITARAVRSPTGSRPSLMFWDGVNGAKPVPAIPKTR